MFSFFSNHGVLGLNARNLLYVKPFNPKKAVALADDKLKTKAFLAARGIPVAKIYGKIEDREQLRHFDFSKMPDECALKPSFGFGGEGILILKGRKNGDYLRQGKELITHNELISHIEDILDGKFSLGGRSDTAFFEHLLTPHDCFKRLRPTGLPDIRIIVFNLIPVMAMVRIPTASSEGKANVHLGGIGIGIDISKGVTTHAAQYHNMITKLPHGESVAGIKIPYWDEMLLISSRIQQMTNIGYLAVDITLDEHMGPAILEVNSRAGLMVQVANLAPLRARLERVKGLKVSSPEKGVRIGQDLFGEKVNKEEEKVEKEERPVLGSHETISITSSGSNITIPCRIAPEEEGTIFTQELIEELKKEKVLCSRKKGEQGYKIKFTLHGKRLQTLITEGKIEGSERALIGRRDLTDFLIDPSKTKEKSTKTRRSSVKTDLRAVDRTLAQIDKELLLLKQLKPINLESEKRRIQEDPRYNPLFTYPELSINTEEIMQKLSKKLSDTSPLGILLEKKRRELRTRIKLMEARGSSKEFTRASIALYGKPTNELLKTAFSLLQQKTPEKEISPEKILPAEKAKPIFEEALESYSLHDWDVAIRSHLLSDCAVGGKHIYLREGAQFSLPHVESLIAHEIETHVLTAENGAHQPYAIFRRGCANYLETQEGLAIYNQNQVLPLTHEKRFGPARSALGVAFGLEHSFADLREYLEKELGYTSEKALSKALDIKRGLTDTSEPGAFTKGIVYLQGLKKIEKFVDANGDIKRLYVGKIALEDLEIVEQIPDLQPPLLLPKFLQE